MTMMIRRAAMVMAAAGFIASPGREKVFAGFLGDESVFGVGPAELETGGESGDPDFADGRVWGDYELGFFGLLEDDLELAAFAFDIETVLVAYGEKAALEVVERGVGFALEVFFVHGFRVSELRLNPLREFIITECTGGALYDFAVPTDQDAGGKANHAAKFIGRGVIADNDGIVHLGFGAVYIETLFLNPGSDDACAFIVHGDADNRETPCSVFLLDFN